LKIENCGVLGSTLRSTGEYWGVLGSAGEYFEELRGVLSVASLCESQQSWSERGVRGS